MNRAQRDALVNLAYSFVPGMKAVIAGGFAADWILAKDLDLWMLADPLLEKTATRFNDMGVRFKRVSDTSSVPDGDVTRSVAIMHTPMMDIHVIGTTEASIVDLLDTFDISTHRWALTREGVQVGGRRATTPYETGRVLTYRFPSSTDARVNKLKDRYDIDILPYVPPTKAA